MTTVKTTALAASAKLDFAPVNTNVICNYLPVMYFVFVSLILWAFTASNVNVVTSGYKIQLLHFSVYFSMCTGILASCDWETSLAFWSTVRRECLSCRYHSHSVENTGLWLGASATRTMNWTLSVTSRRGLESQTPKWWSFWQLGWRVTAEWLNCWLSWPQRLSRLVPGSRIPTLVWQEIASIVVGKVN